MSRGHTVCRPRPKAADLELFEPFKNDLKKKICIGAVSHRTLQADRPDEVAAEIRKALKYIPVERLVVSNDCGFGRQGCNREIAFYKASALATSLQYRSPRTGSRDHLYPRSRSEVANRCGSRSLRILNS